MNEYIEKVTKGEPVNKVDFLYGKHKILWGILSEWEDHVSEELIDDEIKIASLLQKEAVMERMGYKTGEIDGACFACQASTDFEKKNCMNLLVTMADSCSACPFEWTDECGRSELRCHEVYSAWLWASGEEKKKLAKMIRNMPLKEGAEKLYNIIE